MPVRTLFNSAELVEAGMFLARVVYGDLPGYAQDSDSQDWNDPYRQYLATVSRPGGSAWQVLSAQDLPTFSGNGIGTFSATGLYVGEAWVSAGNKEYGEGLLARNGDTVVLTFRGTDERLDSFLGLQAFTAAGSLTLYNTYKPLIDAAYDYVASHSDVKHFVVSGHSLGGTLVDLFAILDAQRFRDLNAAELTMVSIASAGVDEDLPKYNAFGAYNFDANTAVIDTFLGLPHITNLITPADYISIANSDDRVRFPGLLDGDASTPWTSDGDQLVYNDVLLGRLHF
ncbi:MAG: hypothetical protein KDK08_02620, partial [Rhizobiaceae bacterium]|nr:hypothetical protein [Rhizobiaceae bacterium]